MAPGSRGVDAILFRSALRGYRGEELARRVAAQREFVEGLPVRVVELPGHLLLLLSQLLRLGLRYLLGLLCLPTSLGRFALLLLRDGPGIDRATPLGPHAQVGHDA